MPLRTTYDLHPDRTEHDKKILDVLAGIITNGVESGYLRYWAQFEGYGWADDPEHLPGRKFHASVTVREHHESDDPAEWGQPHHLKPEDLLDAALLVINNEVTYYGPLGRDLLDMLINPRDNDDFDAEDADALIQIAVLGSVVYG